MYWGWLTKFCFLYCLQDSVSLWRIWQLFPCGKDPKYPNCFLWPNRQWRPYQQLPPYVELCFSLSFCNSHVSQQNQLPKKPVQPLMLCWRAAIGLLLLFLNILASLCFIHLSWGPDQDQASSHDILSAHNIFAAGIRTEKSVGTCLEGDTSSLRMFMYIHRILPLLSSIFSHRMENNSHSVWILVCCCTFNLKPDIFSFLFISYPGLFQTLVHVCSIHFLYITLFFSLSSLLTIEKFSMLAN